MAGKIIYMAPIENASGKIFGKKERFISVKRSFGNKQKGCSVTGTRNFAIKPLTDREKEIRQTFTLASQLRSMILNDTALKATWAARFKLDTSNKFSTLSGYIQSMAAKGHVDTDGSYK